MSLVQRVFVCRELLSCPLQIYVTIITPNFRTAQVFGHH